MSVTITQRDATNNQSYADYSRKKIGIFNNRHIEGDFKNTSGASLDLKPGMFAVRSASIADGFIPASYTDADTHNLGGLVGIVDINGTVTLANNAIKHVTLIRSGGIDGNNLVLPAGMTLDSLVGSVALKDLLNQMGFDIDFTTVDLTKFDN